VVYTDFSKAFDRVNHGLLLAMLALKFRRAMIFCMGSYRSYTTRMDIGDFLSEMIFCHSGALEDNKMTFVNHIESILSKSARILGFIKRISREFTNKTYKTLYVAFVRPDLEYGSCV
jgi:hypothetical protein